MQEEYKKHINHPSFKSIIEYDFDFNEYMEKRLKDIKDIENFMNNYPRKIFNGKSSKEIYEEHLNLK